MAALQSPSHTLASINAEQLSTSNAAYRAICVTARDGNTTPIQIGGANITATTGGKRLSPGDAFWFGPSSITFSLADIYVAGLTIGDVIDTICV